MKNHRNGTLLSKTKTSSCDFNRQSHSTLIQEDYWSQLLQHKKTFMVVAKTKEHLNNLQIHCTSLKVVHHQTLFNTCIKLDMAVFTHVHGHTTDTRPAVPLGLVFVVGTASLQDGFVNTTTTSNNTCHMQ